MYSMLEAFRAALNLLRSGLALMMSIIRPVARPAPDDDAEAEPVADPDAEEDAEGLAEELPEALADELPEAAELDVPAEAAAAAELWLAPSLTVTLHPPAATARDAARAPAAQTRMMLKGDSSSSRVQGKPRTSVA